MEKSQQPHISPWRPSHVLKDRKGMSKGPLELRVGSQRDAREQRMVPDEYLSHMILYRLGLQELGDHRSGLDSNTP